jgi:hypothetical protein
MGTGWSLSSGRPLAGPVRRCGETFGAIINLSYPVNHMNGSKH